MKVRARLHLFLCGMVACFLGLLLWFRSREAAAQVRLFEQEVASKSQIFDRILALRGESLETLVRDYGLWDELVSFVQTRDRTWADDNLYADALKPFGASGLWVFSLDREELYAAVAAGEAPAGPQVFPSGVFRLLQQQRFVHFYESGPDGVKEFRGATIHPAVDARRETEPRAYLLACRRWSPAHIAELGELTDSAVRLDPNPGPAASLAPALDPLGDVVFGRALADWQGERTALVHIRASSDSLRQFDARSRLYLGLLLALALLSIGAFWWVTMAWIGRPLHLISDSLERGDPARLADLATGQSELGELARLITHFFRQRQELQTEVEERRKAQAALSASRESFHSIVECSTDGILVVDATRRIRFRNAAAADSLPLAGNTEPQPPWPHPLATDVATDIPIRHGDGTRGVGEARVSPTEWEGQHAFLVRIRDVTEQRQAQRSHHLAQIGKLAADMAHEVNNPLMVISGMADLSLMEDIGNAEVITNLRTIIEQARRASDIMTRLLSLSRPGTQLISAIDLTRGLEQVVALVEHPFSLRNVRIVRQLDPALPLARANEKLLQEVCLNLLNNARDAMPDGGVITITTSCAAGSCRITFADTGCGMTDDVRERLLEPFFTTKERGNGLGLCVTNTIVKGLGGSLRFDSLPGHGTTVTVTLPRGEVP